MTGPRPQDQNQGPIIQSVPFLQLLITHICNISNDRLCLESEIPHPIVRFGTHVSGGDTVSRSVRINNPTMFGKCAQ